MDIDEEALAALEHGIAEANRRASADFDGLMGSLPQGVSRLLSEILDELRWVLLDRYSDHEARALLEEYKPVLSADGRSAYRNLTSVPEEVELALRLLNLIGSASKCDGARLTLFLLGPVGLRDAKRQEGTRKPRRPDIEAWLTKQLRQDSTVKAPSLWLRAPDWITDQIGEGRFRKRVTAVRKKLKEDASK